MLEKNRVAGCKVRGCKTRDLVVGKVPRHDAQEHADRGSTHDSATTATEQLDRFVRQEALRVVCVVAVDHGAELHLAACFLERLAHLADDDLREFVDSLVVQVCDAVEVLCPFRNRRVAAPVPVRSSRFIDGDRDLRVGRRWILPQDGAGPWVSDAVDGHRSHFLLLSITLCLWDSSLSRPAEARRRRRMHRTELFRSSAGPVFVLRMPLHADHPSVAVLDGLDHTVQSSGGDVRTRPRPRRPPGDVPTEPRHGRASRIVASLVPGEDGDLLVQEHGLTGTATMECEIVMSGMIVPPRWTLRSCAPRQMPRTGSSASSAAR